MDGIRFGKWWPVIISAVFLIFLGKGQEVSARSFDETNPRLMLVASNTFIFNPKTRVWKAVQNGKVIRSGKASGGSHYCHDVKRACRTPSGTYRVISKGGPECRSSRYPLGKGGSRMPYCMFFSKNYAIHGSYDVPNRNASHGCIRVHPGDARWLSKKFINIGTTVVVHPY
ncbi:L,D-transpeptidase [Legionella fairfieldensis]|uniref:L,D-transpeptidase n=1 Tax=Legionella fairfieldensis TaxID=45064 RepID=UPI00048F7CCA|nr:L,D-transpeptidase [Legionella fairfieldensis]